jgi:putative SOS response-associated peptidase YedK
MAMTSCRECGAQVSTTAAACPHPDTRWLHHRMPVILEEADVERWMDPSADPESLRSLLAGPEPEVIRAVKD